MLVEALQYEKAEYYLWCVLAHCETCDGSESCQTSYVGLHEQDECYSATWNYLGFVNRKKASPDFAHAETYYRTALGLWPGNCGAYASVAASSTLGARRGSPCRRASRESLESLSTRRSSLDLRTASRRASRKHAGT